VNNEHHRYPAQQVIYDVYRYFDVAELAAIDWYRLLMKDVDALCHQQVSEHHLSIPH